MTTDFVDLAKEQLHEHLEESGSVLFSSWDTLRPGRIYLLGYNPGGTPDLHPSLGEHLENLPARSRNAYLDETWEKRKQPGEATLQKRISYLLESLGQDVADVCASNLIFVRSKDSKKVDPALAEPCWPVHEHILSVVQPELILAYGNANRNSTYSFLQRKLGTSWEEVRPSGRKGYRLKAFGTDYVFDEGLRRDLTVVGLPHLSWYKIDKYLDVIPWIKSKAGWD